MRARKLIAGNWKMNGLQENLAQAQELAGSFKRSNSDILICPPATLLQSMHALFSQADAQIHTGGQDCHPNDKGAHTGDISAQMLKDAGAQYVILGHSERRSDHNENDALVCQKVEAATNAGLIPIVCVGETLEERENGTALDVVRSQLKASIPGNIDMAQLVVAYEPVWAIGTGKVPTIQEIEAIHNDMRARLVTRFGETATTIPLLYGGSVKASNATEIFKTPNVDGALVGGASLKAADFGGIIDAMEAL